MRTLRTPDERFVDIPNFPPYSPHYCELDDDEGGRLRVAWVDEGPEHAEPILLLHGEPTWSDPSGGPHLCPPRRVDARARVRRPGSAAGDPVRSGLGGRLIGLRLAAENADRFARIVVANTGLPTGDFNMPEVWWQFRRAIQEAPSIDVADSWSRVVCDRSPTTSARPTTRPSLTTAFFRQVREPCRVWCRPAPPTTRRPRRTGWHGRP